MELIKEIGLKPPTKSKYGLYKCHCGNEFETQISRVKNGFTKSCGCLRNIKSSNRMKKYNTKHGGTGTRLHNIWLAIRKRCDSHKHYLGISVCIEWNEFCNFRDWAILNGYKEHLTIDRIDTLGNYEPSNCRWTDMKTQAQNREKKTDKEYSSIFKGVYYDKKSKKYRANITVNGKRFNLGLYLLEEDAKNAYNTFVINNKLKHRIN